MDYAVSKLTSEVSRTFKDTHINTLISLTHDKTVPMLELFYLISNRLRDERWIVVLKTLSLIHLLSREGNSERVMGFLCANNDMLHQSVFRKQGPYTTKIIQGYSVYLQEKVDAYRILKYDWIRQQGEAVAMFRSIGDEVQLLRDSELLQKNMQAALAVGFALEIDSTDFVIQQTFRFILAEYFNLFLLANESMTRILELYFKMEMKNAIKALELYKTFVSQTKRLQEIFLSAKLNLSTQVEIPLFKIPPVGLITTLKDYISDPEYETIRLATNSGSLFQSNLGTKLLAVTEPTTTLVSHFHVINGLNRNSIVGGAMDTTATAPRTVNVKQPFIQQQNSAEIQSNLIIGRRIDRNQSLAIESTSTVSTRNQKQP